MMSALEAQSITIIREAVAAAQNPVMMYSAGKDSSVMLHLARKAFFPSAPPFPLLHIDTTWKFQEMYAHRDLAVRESGMKLVVYSNPEGLADNVTPFTRDSEQYTDIMKTQALRQALDRDQYDVIFGGARRDEEKSRAKERIFSFRKAGHQWDAKNQRPELWDLYNTHKRQGETMRVFPLSNWTELDIWLYIYAEKIPLVPLYFAAERNVVLRDGQLIMVDDDRFELRASETIKRKKVRFRTLGCYPLTAAVESDADTIEGIIWETFGARTSERSGRLIDADSPGSMEKKKQAGYF